MKTQNQSVAKSLLLVFRVVIAVTFIFSLGTFDAVQAATGIDLTITKTHTGSFAQGETGTYTITVTNSGDTASDGTDIFVADIVPEGLDPVGISSTDPNWLCTQPPFSDPPDVSCHREVGAMVLAAGASFPAITVTFTVLSIAPNPVINQATVSGGGDSNTSNNTASDPTTVIQSDLVITNVTLSPQYPAPGQPYTVFVTIQNQGGASTGTVPYVDLYYDTDPGINPGTGCPPDFGDYNTSYFSALPAGGTRTEPIDISSGVGLTAGYHPIWAYVDAGCTITESNESNNKFGPFSTKVLYDDFSLAKVISGVPFIDANINTTTATTAPDDPSPNCNNGQGYASIWYSFTPSTSGAVYLDTLGSDYDTLIAVWTGTQGNLTSVVCNNNANSTLQSATFFNASAGTTYLIEIVQHAPSTPPQVGGTLQFHVTSFGDAPGNHWAWRWIEGLYKAGITGGCGLPPSRFYCPDSLVNRAQMAIFLLKSRHGPSYAPPPVGAGTGFSDVPTSYWAAAWIKQLAAEGITGGCGVGLYCPESSVTRAQMAVFLLKSKYGTSYAPPPVGAGTGFNDVPTNYWAAAWIKELAAEGITGGCGVGLYCPESSVTRAQMAVFLDKAFNFLPLP